MAERRQEFSRETLVATEKAESMSWTREHLADIFVAADLASTGAASAASGRWEIAAGGIVVAIGAIGVKYASQMIGREK